jgi:hypothetical protein
VAFCDRSLEPAVAKGHIKGQVNSYSIGKCRHTPSETGFVPESCAGSRPRTWTARLGTVLGLGSSGTRHSNSTSGVVEELIDLTEENGVEAQNLAGVTITV